MAKSNKRYNEDQELDDIMTVNSEADVARVKAQINKHLPKVIKVVAKNESQKKLINSIRNKEITICAGPPGTGKTFVSVAYALSLLRKKENRFRKIYLVKSVTALKGEEVGLLKGDLEEKIKQVMWSFMINMEKIITTNSITQLFEEDVIRPFPLAYMKGASLDDCIIVADEMQNVSMDNSRTLLTRIGSNCKLILLGDINQIDLRNKNESSLEKLLGMFADEDEIGVINMGEEDTENVRNPLITMIEEKYNKYIEEH